MTLAEKSEGRFAINLKGLIDHKTKIVPLNPVGNLNFMASHPILFETFDLKPKMITCWCLYMKSHWDSGTSESTQQLLRHFIQNQKYQAHNGARRKVKIKEGFTILRPIHSVFVKTFQFGLIDQHCSELLLQLNLTLQKPYTVCQNSMTISTLSTLFFLIISKFLLYLICYWPLACQTNAPAMLFYSSFSLYFLSFYLLATYYLLAFIYALHA